MASKYTIQHSTLTDIGDAIRTKTGKSEAFTPAQMVTEILNIPTGSSSLDAYDIIPPLAFKQGLISLSRVSSSWMEEYYYYNSTATTVLASAFEGIQYPSGSLVRIRSITLENVRYIGQRAFQYLTEYSYMREIYCPNALVIDDYAFQGCSLVTHTEVMSKAFYIGNYAFDGASYGAFGLNYGEQSRLLYIGKSAFRNCRILDFRLDGARDLQYIDDCAFYSTYLDDWKSRLQSMFFFSKCIYVGSSNFQYCSKITSIQLSHCLSFGQWAFSSCSNLSKLYAPRCQSIGAGAFNYCEKLNQAAIDDCTIIGYYAFAYCRSLSSVICSNLRFVGSSAFTSCPIPRLDIKGSYQDPAYIGEYAFYYCSKLSTVTVNYCSRIASGAFMGCSSLKTLIIRNHNSVCQLLNSNAFSSCGIINGGTIQVPSSMYNSYYNDSVWSWFRTQLSSIE